MVRTDSRHMDFMRKSWSYYNANRLRRPKTHIHSSTGFDAGSTDFSLIHPSKKEHHETDSSKGNREY